MRSSFAAPILIISSALAVFILLVLVTFVNAHPQAFYVITGLVGIALIAIVYGIIHAVATKIGERRYYKRLRQLEIEEQENAIRLRKQVIEQQALEAVENRRWQQEQFYARLNLDARKLEIESEKVKVDAYRAQAVEVKNNNALVIRGYDGQSTRIAYEPRVKVTQVVGDVELVSEDELKQLSAPKVNAVQLLSSGELDVKSEKRNDDYILFGVDEAGKPIRKTWKSILSILVLGLMGGGKTNTTLWILLQLVLKGYKIALLDKHAKSDESTHARLKDFNAAYDTPVGDSPQAAMRVMKHVRRVFTDRMDRGAPIDYKLVFVAEELTAMMRALTDKTSDWHEVAVYLINLLGDLNTEGRKYGVHVLAIGQATNASRTGGTEVRDLFHTRVVHGMRARQAQMLGLTEEKNDIQKLEAGQVYLDIEGREDPFKLIIPEVTAEFILAVKSRIMPTRSSGTLVENATFEPRSPDVLAPVRTRSTVHFEPPMNAVQTTPEPRLPEKAERVLSLRKLNAGKAAIILEVWGAKKGGSAAYQQAEIEYTQIVENLIALGYLQVQQ